MIFVHRNIDFATQKSLRTIIDVQCRAIVKLKSTKNVQTKGHLEVVQLPGSTYFVLGDLGGHYSGSSWYLGIGLCTVHISHCVYIHMFDLARSLFCCLRPPRVTQISWSGDLIFCKHTLFKCPLCLRRCVLTRYLC